MAPQQDIGNRIPITASFMLATMMNTLDSTIANVALPHIQGSVSASQDEITWVLTSYILAQALMTPLSGWLSQKLGRKLTLLFSIVGFTGASMLCGVATTVPELVLYRLLQGAAGAAMGPLSQTMLLDLFEPRLLPRVMSIWSATFVLGPIIGPTLGGWLTEHMSWRWCFYINAPFGIISALGVYVFMAKDAGGRQRPFDFLGFGSLAVAIAGFQLMLDRGPGADWFDAYEIWLYATLAVGGAWVFVTHTLSAEQPFFHRDLAKDRNYVTTTIFSVFMMALLFSTTAVLPSFMQNLLGYSALQSGWLGLPRAFGSLFSFAIVPFLIPRLGARTVLIVGVLGAIWSLWIMTHFDLMMTTQPILISGLIQGLGMGMLFAPLNTLAYITLHPEHRMEGATVGAMVRSLGSAAGISLVQAMVIRTGALAHGRLAEGVDLADPLVRAQLPPVMEPTTAAGAMILNAEVTRQAAMIGYVDVFSWLFLLTFILLPLAMILRPSRM